LIRAIDANRTKDESALPAIVGTATDAKVDFFAVGRLARSSSGAPAVGAASPTEAHSGVGGEQSR
jgi:hypothetical protein